MTIQTPTYTIETAPVREMPSEMLRTVARVLVPARDGAVPHRVVAYVTRPYGLLDVAGAMADARAWADARLSA